MKVCSCVFLFPENSFDSLLVPDTNLLRGMPSSMAGPVRVLFQIRRIGTQGNSEQSLMTLELKKPSKRVKEEAAAGTNTFYPFRGSGMFPRHVEVHDLGLPGQTHIA